MGERWRVLGVVEMESRKVGKREVESIFEKVYGKNVGGRVAKEEGGGEVSEYWTSEHKY